MRRKNFIIIILLAITLGLIVFVRYVIKRDTQQTQKSRLDTFSSSLDMQRNFILSSYEKSAQIISNNLCRDEILKQKINAYIKSNSLNEAESVIELNNYIDALYRSFQKQGISNLIINLNSSEKSTVNDRLSSNRGFINEQFEHAFETDTLDLNFLKGFSIGRDFIGYKFIFPLPYNKTKTGQLEIGFDFHSIKEDIYAANENIEIGYIYFSNERKIQLDEITQLEFIEKKELDRNWIDHEFNLPVDLLRDKKKLKVLNEKLSTNNTDNPLNFSIYSNNGSSASAISFVQIRELSQQGSLFLVSISNDHLLTLVKQLNNAILIINIIIIVLAMLGILYLILSRFSIISNTNKIIKSEEKLKALNQSKDKFFSIIAHDLKNPFNGIMGMSGYLNSEYENVSDAERKEIIDDINLASKNAFNLLQNLLEWTRAQSGDIKNNPTTIEPKQIVELSLETVLTLAKSKEIELKQTYLTKSYGYADENLLATIIRNLCTNAIKFSPRNSEIEIMVKEYKNELVFCIKDQGIGLNPDEIDKLFKIDFNFQKRGTEKETGTGLGLKLCKEFVEYCQGKIWVVSEQGKGSDFYFTIPIKREG